MEILGTVFFLLLIMINTGASAATEAPFACDALSPSTNSYIFCNISLPISERVANLISLLTLEEKIGHLGNTAPAIHRLGIPGYEWRSEALHGVSNKGLAIRFNGLIRSATSFPQVILTAASFDTHLWYRIGQSCIQCRTSIRNDILGTKYKFRDPRWGRGQETPGEDPMVTSSYSVSYVRGIQGDSFQGGKINGDNKHILQASACCKHFTAYDLDNWSSSTRYNFDAHVSLQDMADTCQPPFKSCVEEGKASGVMCAYNRVNGVPSCADFNFLSNTIRGKWGFNGYITSDSDSVSTIYTNQSYSKTPEELVGEVLRAGMDVNCAACGEEYSHLLLLSNLFTTRMRLGLFNGNPIQQQFGDISPSHVCSAKHQTLALEAARDGIVTTQTIAAIGPNANVVQTLMGNYNGPPCKSVTPVEALKSYVRGTLYHPGCDAVPCNSLAMKEAVELAKSVDYVIMIMGLDQTQEREELDRVDLVLPGKQQHLISRVAKAAKKPVILVLLSGGPVDISFAKDDHNVGSIIWAGYPGEAGGIALAEIIFGDHNPGGRLPVTWYPQEFIKIPMTDMRMRSDSAMAYPGRTYRFYKARKVFDFGYGLSYSTYLYEFVNVNRKTIYLNRFTNILALDDKLSTNFLSISEMGTEYCEKLKFSVTIGVKNSGVMAGKHPVLLFVRQLEITVGSPIIQLIGFQTVKTGAGERTEVEFVVSPCEHLSKADENGIMVIEEGSYSLAVGDIEHDFSIIFNTIFGRNTLK
ncbi:hypothetical protein MKX01_015681 [Papaver californicum]|nr:hypothetical protein MKX01_015681 [Papaver californicum]